MALTEKEALLICGLANDPAYILLMEKLQFIIDNVTDQLHVADSKTIAEIMPVWKALRTVYIELKNTPQEVVDWAKTLTQTDVSSVPLNVKTGDQLKEFLKHLQNQRDSVLQEDTIEELYKYATPNANSFGNII